MSTSPQVYRLEDIYSSLGRVGSEAKARTQDSYDNDELLTEASMVAARQQISREDLAKFDASVRSWLSSADTAKTSQGKGLMLIVKNIPSPPGASTYAKVINMWKSAMVGLECLLKGMPQEAQDGSILLALSAWHLYPDLIALSTDIKKVEFSDPEFPSAGVLTVGLQQADNREEDDGFKWSLALSNLRYYGDPVNVEIRDTNTRMTMRQLHLAALGVLLGYWNVKRSDTMYAAVFFKVLWRSVASDGRAQDPQTPFPGYCWVWLRAASSAADELLSSKGEEQDV